MSSQLINFYCGLYGENGGQNKVIATQLRCQKVTFLIAFLGSTLSVFQKKRNEQTNTKRGRQTYRNRNKKIEI